MISRPLRFLVLSVCASLACAAPSATRWQQELIRALDPATARDHATALQRADEVLPMLAAAVEANVASSASSAWVERPSLGPSLATYAKNTGADQQRFETFAEASRRILAGGSSTRRAPDATSRWFAETADLLLATIRAAESLSAEKRSPAFDAAVTHLKILAYYSRFHSHRIIAAVRYNLFLRGQRLAELYAATLESRAAVEAWRALDAVAGDRPVANFFLGPTSTRFRGTFREELIRLQFDLKDLEEQCCPPDEAIIREKIWTPVLAP